MRLQEEYVFLRGCKFSNELTLFLGINMCLLKYPHGWCNKTIILSQQTWNFRFHRTRFLFKHFIINWQNYQGMHSLNINQEFHFAIQVTKSFMKHDLLAVWWRAFHSLLFQNSHAYKHVMTQLKAKVRVRLSKIKKKKKKAHMRRLGQEISLNVPYCLSDRLLVLKLFFTEFVNNFIFKMEP